MTMRMHLVGVVASLGLTLPSGERLDYWAHCGKTWFNARLVEWESNASVGEHTFVRVADAVEVALASTPRVEIGAADLDAKASARTGKALVQAPAAAKTETPARAEDLDLNAAIEQRTVTAPKTLEIMEEQAEVTAWLCDKLAEWSGQPIVDEVCFVVTPASVAFARKPVSATPADPDRVFQNVVEAMAVAFARDNASARTAEAQAAVKVPAFEPLKVGDNLYPGVASVLNREAEGVGASVPATPAQTVSNSVPQPSGTIADRLTHALRLTREAVNAWANLLHPPAVITIAH